MPSEEISALVKTARARADAIQEESVACFNAARQAGAILLEAKQQGLKCYTALLMELNLDKHRLRVLLNAARKHPKDVNRDAIYSSRCVGSAIARLMTAPWERKKTHGT